MSKTLISLLVGAHFRPPAKQVLAALPSAWPLLLSPEPENPYDPSALKVLCHISGLPTEALDLLDGSLEGTGTTIDELLEQEDPIWLGYVAASGGKPLAKAGLIDGNQEFLALMGGEPNYSATLAFGPAGEPMVRLNDGEA